MAIKKQHIFSYKLSGLREKNWKSKKSKFWYDLPLYLIKKYFLGSALIEENVSQLSKEVAELKRISQRLEQDLLGAKNDVGNVQESLAQVVNFIYDKNPGS